MSFFPNSEDSDLPVVMISMDLSAEASHGLRGVQAILGDPDILNSVFLTALRGDIDHDEIRAAFGSQPVIARVSGVVVQDVSQGTILTFDGEVADIATSLNSLQPGASSKRAIPSLTLSTDQLSFDVVALVEESLKGVTFKLDTLRCVTVIPGQPIATSTYDLAGDQDDDA